MMMMMCSVTMMMASAVAAVEAAAATEAAETVAATAASSSQTATTPQTTTDMEKLQLAFSEIMTNFGSIDAIMDAFGLSEMPAAQMYGIIFGCIVFTLTVSAVVTLLVLGGSFKRIAQQTETGEATPVAAHDLRSQRALLLENLLEGRERMRRKYGGHTAPTTDQVTALTKMLLNVVPGETTKAQAAKASENNKNDELSPTSAAAVVMELLVGPSPEKQQQQQQQQKKNDNIAEEEEEDALMTQLYKENYVAAYRKCQDRPGGSVISGRPEARFEAYARAYAGCGPYTSPAYRRSYGRMYEAITCASHKADDKFSTLFQQRPHDIVGRVVRLEALEVDRHLEDLFRGTSGEPVYALDTKKYEPEEIWGFLEDGPFTNAAAMRQSFVFQRKANEAGFAIIHNLTDRMIGMIMLRNDDPTNLTIQIEPPIMQPVKDGSPDQLEACFLLMDRLFALGYRRIQISIDSQDAAKRKLAVRLGFTHEGVCFKHMVVKEANRDSNIYGLINTDWKSGARAALFKKLYGAAAYKADHANEKKEEELDEQERVLAEQARKEAEGETNVEAKKER